MIGTPDSDSISWSWVKPWTRRDVVGTGTQSLLAGFGLTAVAAGQLGDASVAAAALPGIVSLTEVGAVGDGKTDDTAAIRKAFRRVAASPSGGIVYAPPGIYATRGGHVIRPRMQLLGAGTGATVFRHIGERSCFILTGPGITEHRIGISGCSILGNSAKTAVGVEFRDISFGAWARLVRVRDYLAGTGFLLHNVAPRQYCEGVMLLGCSSSNNRTGVALRRLNGTNSFKGFYTEQFACNVPASGTGFDFGVGGDSQIVVYNCCIHGHIWFDRHERNIGWDVGANAILRDGQAWMSGEGSSKTSLSIRNRQGGSVTLFGQWWFNQIPNDADLRRTKIGPLTGAALGA